MKMNQGNPNIVDLLPQRPPMVMLDSLCYCQGPVAKGRLHISPDNLFTRDGVFMESGMIEAMAQTAAARTGLLQKSQPDGEKKEVPIGVLGSIKDFRLFLLPREGETIETEIEVVHEFMNASVIRGIVSVGGTEACSAEMKIFLTVDNPS